MSPSRKARRHVALAYEYLQRTSADQAQHMEEAIAHFIRALDAMDPVRDAEEWALRQNDLASAYTDRIRGDPAANLDEAIRHYTLALEANASTAVQRGSMHANLGSAYRARINGDRAQNLEHAIAHYQQALGVFTQGAYPLGWAQLHQLLGAVYSDRILGDRAQNAEDAIAHLHQALNVLTRDDQPAPWAGVCALLGLVYGYRVGHDRAENLEQAIGYLERALQVYAPGTHPQEWAGTVVTLAAVYLERVRGAQSRNAETAIGYLQRAAEVIDADDPAAQELDARLGQAFLRARGDPSENTERAITYLRRALDHPSGEAFPGLLATVQGDLGYAYLNRERGDVAENVEAGLSFLEHSLESFARQGDREGWTQANLNLGVAYLRRARGGQASNDQRATDCFDRVFEVHTRRARPREWAAAHVTVATAYRDRQAGDRARNLQQTIEHGELASQVYARDTDPEEWAKTQLLLARAYNLALHGDRVQNIERAIEHGDRALDVYTRNAFPEEYAAARTELGEAWRQRLRGDPEENLATAISQLDQALEVYTRDRHPYGWARCHHGLGSVYLEILRRGARAPSEAATQAVQHFERALEVFTRDAYPDRYAETQLNLGLGLSVSGSEGNQPEHIEEAIARLRQALELTARETNPERWAALHTNLGMAYRDRFRGDRSGNRRSAAEHLRLALKVLSPDVFPARYRTTFEGLGRLYFDDAAWSEALAAFEQAIRAGDLLLTGAYTERGRQEEAGETSRLYTAAAWCLLELGQPGQALQRLEAGKARLLAEALALRDIDLTGLAEADRAALVLAREQVRALEARMRLDLTEPAGGGDPDLAERLRIARTELVRRTDAIRREHPDLLPTGLALPEIVGLVPVDGALVAPLITNHGGAAFVVPHGAAEVGTDQLVPLPGLTEDALGSLIRPLAERPGSPTPVPATDGLDEVTARLWELLMGPVHERLVALGLRPQAPVVVILPGGLSVLPVHAAWRTDGRRRRHTLDDWTFTFAPSAYALMVSRRRLADPRRHERSLLAVANPTGDLPFAVPEVEDVVATFAPGRRDVLGGPDATRDRLLAATGGHSYFHLACHGAYDWTDPMRSWLLLAGHDPLTLAAIISDLDLERARLVALSACESGLTDISTAPDEYIGLPAGFLQAGAPAVLASLWPVADLSTSLLMQRFYHDHLGGRNPAAALRGAQLWLREATAAELQLAPRWDHQWRQSGDPDAFRQSRYWRAHPDEVPFADPYHWASFVCVGA
jgi:CHAT domain-containing protein/tetratricopeptide (TPR) repeat protein